MDEFKEFQGKSLDEAIQSACTYYNAVREKLEIDIVQDAKNGIFGLVGARKAIVRARRVAARMPLGQIQVDARPEKTEKPERADRPERPERSERQERSERPERQERQEKTERPERQEQSERTERQERPARQERAERPERSERQERPERQEKAPRTPENEDAENSADAAPSAESGTRREDDARRGRRRGSRRPEGGEPRAREGQPAEAPTNGEPSARPEGRKRREPGSRPERGPRGERQERPDRPERQDRPVRPERGEPRETTDADLDDAGEGLARIPFDQLDQEKLQTLALETACKLVCPILGPDFAATVEERTGTEAGGPVRVVIGANHVEAHVDCGENSGLLIGREGQTLTSLQYLASRIVSRGMGASVRVQFNVGDYRERQDDRLRDLALSLADRVRATGRSCSTRPMSSYHRRIIHLTLQDSPDVQTRSSGDGPLKRIIVQRRKNGSDRADETGRTACDVTVEETGLPDAECMEPTVKTEE